jgi:hypothetical protein
MNHIKALAVANSMNQDRLESARRRRYSDKSVKPDKPRRPNLGHMLRAYLVGLRARTLPSR